MPALPLLVAGLLLGHAPPGLDEHIELHGATLFVPPAYRPAGDLVDVVFHLHGAPLVVEPAFIDLKWNAVLIEFNREGLSSVYAKPMAHATLFRRLLESALAGDLANRAAGDEGPLRMEGTRSIG